LILQRKNAPVHKVLSAKQFLAQKRITAMENPPYFLDFTPNDFRLFQKTKSALNGRRFQDIEDIKRMLRRH
jgi:hypothetical protein